MFRLLTVVAVGVGIPAATSCDRPTVDAVQAPKSTIAQPPFPDRTFALRYFSELSRVIHESATRPDVALKRALRFVRRYDMQVAALKVRTRDMSANGWERTISQLSQQDHALHDAVQRYRSAVAEILTAPQREQWKEFRRLVVE